MVRPSTSIDSAGGGIIGSSAVTREVRRMLSTSATLNSRMRLSDRPSTSYPGRSLRSSVREVLSPERDATSSMTPSGSILLSASSDSVLSGAENARRRSRSTCCHRYEETNFLDIVGSS